MSEEAQEVRMVVSRSGVDEVCSACEQPIVRGAPFVAGLPGRHEDTKVCVACIGQILDLSRYLFRSVRVRE